MRHGKGQTFIDFFVVSDGIAAGTQDQRTDLSAVIPTHRLVGFSLQCDIGGLTSTAHVSLDRLPTEPAFGPRAPELPWRAAEDAVYDALDRAQNSRNATCNRRALTKAVRA